MSRITVDDTSSSIRYTGWWEPSWGSPANSAWDYGSQATFSFKGTSVFVYGDVSEGDGEVVRVDFSIDGGSVASKYQTSRENKVTNVLWYDSGNLPDGDHTLTMTYLPVDDMDFRLDRIEYTPSPPPSSHNPPPPPPPPVVTTSTSVALVVQTTTSSRTEVVGGTSAAADASRTGAPDSESTSPSSTSQASVTSLLTQVINGQTVTQTQYLPTTGATDAARAGVSTGDDSQSGTSADATAGSSTSKVPVGAIVGGVLGSLLALCLLALIFILVRWRRRRTVSYALALEKGSSSNESQASISPFNNYQAPERAEHIAPAAPTSKAALMAREAPHQPSSSSASDTGYATPEAGRHGD